MPLFICCSILLIDFYYLPSEEKTRQKSKRDAIEKAVKGIILIIDARIA